jgi:methylisocitrate lyase
MRRCSHIATTAVSGLSGNMSGNKSRSISPGARFRDALTQEQPLQIVGTINAYAAMMAERSGFRALYLSGAGVANASFGLPDLGVTTLNDVLEDARRITGATSLPVLVDIDTGFGGAFSIARTIREMIRAGVAAVHIEDQVQAKRCGHRPGKALVSSDEMIDRIKAAVDARSDPDFVIMARTDALASEGLDRAVERAVRYRDAGADMIFAEAVTDLEQYRRFAADTGVPILANITEFGKTPLFNIEELAAADVAMALYPLSAFRAMSAAALDVYRGIRTSGTQADMLPRMQTRQELYDFLNYLEYEQKLDRLFARENRDGDN